MAAKGHSYEISNREAVRAFIFRTWLMARDRSLDRACEWIMSNHFQRFVTGPNFSFALKPAHVLKTIEKDENSPYILGKIAGGHEVRRFSEFLFETKGPDLEHILDWVADLKSRLPREYDKVPRMAVEVVSQKARQWTEALGRQAKGDGGQNALVIEIDREMAWYELSDPAALKYEGAMMSHCVGGDHYAKGIASGATRIFSLRFNRLKPVLTLELNTSSGMPVLAQIQKQANGGLPIALCDAVTALLNHLGACDGFGRSHRYGLVFEDDVWSTIYDKWGSSETVGRRALSDGSNTLFMCVTDTSKPLLLASNVLVDGKMSIQVKSACDAPPHYSDQVEASDIVNLLRAEAGKWYGMNVDWLQSHPDTNLIIPAVDAYERRDANGLTFYARPASNGTPETFFLPHGNDPARLIMEAHDVRHLKRARVCANQHISKSQIDRCLAFLDEMDVFGLGFEDDDYREPETKEFKKKFDPVRVGNSWKAFALDCTESDAVKSEGKWAESNYLIRYSGKIGGRLDLNVLENRLSGSYSWGIQKDDLKEVIAHLNKVKLFGDGAVKLEMVYNTEFPVLLIMHGGKWNAVDGPKQVERYVSRVLSRPRPGKASREGIYAGLLSYIAELHPAMVKKGKSIEGLLKTRNQLLPLWLNDVKDFDAYLARNSSFWFSGFVKYPLTERLCDLADSGYRPETPRQIAQLKKAIKRVVASYPRGRIHFPIEDEFGDLAIRWHSHMSQSALNKLSGTLVRFKSWEATRDAACAYMTLMEDRQLARTRLGRAIRDRAERMVREADYSEMPMDQVKSYARLCDHIVQGSWVYSSHVASITSLLEALPPADDESIAIADDESIAIRNRLANVVARCAKEGMFRAPATGHHVCDSWL